MRRVRRAFQVAGRYGATLSGVPGKETHREKAEEMTCPVCSAELRHLGHIEDSGTGLLRWVGENLYQCPECKYPNKNYQMERERLTPSPI